MEALNSLTPEQARVVHHPLGRHAIVLAVAGSGKTTTMVHRVRFLLNQGVQPSQLLVLMFNKLAREQFKAKCLSTGLPSSISQQIHSFHSYSFRILQRARLDVGMEIWGEEKAEVYRNILKRAIRAVEKSERLPQDSIDPEEAANAISLWKGALIPAEQERAGYTGSPHMPKVYQEFEKMRLAKSAITFDDFVPMAVGILESAHSRQELAVPRYQHVIVDEYQDVNWGQQRLTELVAGRHADVMAVGDDDQTIYEWRGARPNYIRHLFHERFAHKPADRYVLTTSFRFGPVLAQAAENVISLNGGRGDKRVVAHDVRKPAAISIIATSSEQSSDVEREIADQVAAYIRWLAEKGQRDLSDRVAVLGRTFSQLASLQATFVRRRIPFRVVGSAPLFGRREIVVLLHYCRLAEALRAPITADLTRRLVATANAPSRYLLGKDVAAAASIVQQQGGSVLDVLDLLRDGDRSSLTAQERDTVSEWRRRLERLAELVTERRAAAASLHWLVEVLGYRKYLTTYYGDSEESSDRTKCLDAFLDFAKASNQPIADFINIVESIDVTCGVPVEEQVTFTTVFRTKGLEYDLVVIPSCLEGFMPSLRGDRARVHDLAGIVPSAEPSPVVDNERRLFYVGLTRARSQVLIGTVAPPMTGHQENSSVPVMSRFLAEMRLEPTMQMLGWLADGDPVGAQTAVFGRVCGAAVRNRDLRAAAEILIGRYLPAAGCDVLAARVSALLADEPIAPFSYPPGYF